MLAIWWNEVWISKILILDFREWKELLKWNKKHFSLFHKYFLLDLKNKLAKMLWTQPLKMFVQLLSRPNDIDWIVLYGYIKRVNFLLEPSAIFFMERKSPF